MICMKIVYYENVVTKEVTNYNKLPEDWTEEKIGSALKEFNQRETGKCNAVIIDVEEGSFIGYLIKRLEAKIAVKPELIEEALDALDHAESCVRALQ